MARIEIDENEYAELKRVYGVAELIGKHPEARARLQEAVSIAAPEQAGPEIRIRKEVDEKLSGIEKMLREDRDARAKEREEAQAEAAKRDLENRWLSGRKSVKDDGYTDEGLKALEDWMEKNGVADHRIAAAAFERENPPPQPVVSGGSRWDLLNNNEQNGQAGELLKKLIDTQGQDDNVLGALVDLSLKEVRGR